MGGAKEKMVANDDKDSEAGKGGIPFSHELKEYERYHQSIIRMRWLAVGFYLISVIALTIIPAMVDAERFENIGDVIGFVVIIETIGLLAIIAYPFLANRSPPRPPPVMKLVGDVDRPAIDLTRIWFERVRLKMIVLGAVIVIVIFAVTAVNSSSPDDASWLLIGLAILVVVLLIFSHLEISCSPKALSFHYGPFGKTFPLERIERIRAVSVNPLKEYMGWGIRVGADGSIGYIAAGKVGVRIELDEGKDYVVTVSDPQSLVDYVEAAKRSGGVRSE